MSFNLKTIAIAAGVTATAALAASGASANPGDLRA